MTKIRPRRFSTTLPKIATLQLHLQPAFGYSEWSFFRGSNSPSFAYSKDDNQFFRVNVFFHQSAIHIDDMLNYRDISLITTSKKVVSLILPHRIEFQLSTFDGHYESSFQKQQVSQLMIYCSIVKQGKVDIQPHFGLQKATHECLDNLSLRQ